MALAIRRLLAERDLSERLTREGFARALNLYDINRLVSRYASLLTGRPDATVEDGGARL